MRKALQQGQADGLCGLYAVLNFLNRTEWREAPSDGLWYLLDACRQFDWFTPQHLVEGYEDHNLKAILDLQFRNYRLGFETAFLSDVASKYPDQSTRQILGRVVKRGGSVIVQTAKGGHWLLVTGKAGKPVVYDSADGCGDPVPIEKRSISSAAGWGVVILPSKRPTTPVEI